MLKSLQLTDFRNHTSTQFVFDQRVVFFGENGRGKTNILESIFVLSTGKSWREHKGVDLILHGQESALILGETQMNDQIKVLIQPRSRQFWHSGKKISLKKHFGFVPSLLFVPEHLHLFSGPKANRQRYFDRFLAQISPTYREDLMRCERARRQKLALINMYKESFYEDLLPHLRPWNEILAATIPRIWHERQKMLETLVPLLQQELDIISQSSDLIQIILTPPDEFDATPEGVKAFFEESGPREHIARRALIGPHRDDFCFFLRTRPLTATASRGETRSVLLALLSAMKQMLKSEIQADPILLLDDVFSELDDHRQMHLEQLCGESQVFFTTTHEAHFERFRGEVQRVPI